MNRGSTVFFPNFFKWCSKRCFDPGVQGPFPLDSRGDESPQVARKIKRESTPETRRGTKKTQKGARIFFPGWKIFFSSVPRFEKFLFFFSRRIKQNRQNSIEIIIGAPGRKQPQTEPQQNIVRSVSKKISLVLFCEKTSLFFFYESVSVFVTILKKILCCRTKKNSTPSRKAKQSGICSKEMFTFCFWKTHNNPFFFHASNWPQIVEEKIFCEKKYCLHGPVPWTGPESSRIEIKRKEKTLNYRRAHWRFLQKYADPGKIQKNKIFSNSVVKSRKTCFLWIGPFLTTGHVKVPESQG